jgi:hypothetical protein
MTTKQSKRFEKLYELYGTLGSLFYSSYNKHYLDECCRHDKLLDTSRYYQKYPFDTEAYYQNPYKRLHEELVWCIKGVFDNDFNLSKHHFMDPYLIHHKYMHMHTFEMKAFRNSDLLTYQSLYEQFYGYATLRPVEIRDKNITQPFLTLEGADSICQYVGRYHGEIYFGSGVNSYLYAYVDKPFINLIRLEGAECVLSLAHKEYAQVWLPILDLDISKDEMTLYIPQNEQILELDRSRMQSITFNLKYFLTYFQLRAS